MPVVVFVLAAAVFAQGTSEFMVSGLLEQIAQDVGVSLGTAGLLTSLFAVGMVLGAPVMAVTASRVPIRYSVTLCSALFCAAHVLGAATGEFAVLLVSRLLAAVADAGFLALTLAALPRLVGTALIGRATSLVVSGVTVACIAGVPAGTLLGQIYGWRSAFWAVAVLSAVVAVPVWVMLGDVRDPAVAGGPASPIRREWPVLGQPVVRTAVIAAILVNAATFAGFTYLGTVTAEVTDDGRWVALALALFGVGSFAGVTIAGRYSDRHHRRITLAGTVVLIGVWLLAAVTAQAMVAVMVMSAVAGAVAFGVGSTLIATIVRTAAPIAPRIAGALSTTAFNIGAVLGPATAGRIVDHTGHPAAAWWCGAVFATAAAGVLAFRGRVRREHHSAATDSNSRDSVR
ncbi:Cmx/CmrA family chloramphenicol efflux MFS transporter [Nocardia spumae]|uniref:Cmx/CmrA family chloramphenicol efflux MFS transporter n=1 Tax=Nocardia spumae TaxID=2887190 RepID=UPI001D15E3D3|nr:Cmx/CmrA family chloramphenicol efflux MFS transporter [Nocardia spumae]